MTQFLDRRHCPIQNPYFYYKLSENTYVDNISQMTIDIANVYPGIKVLENYEYRKWKFVLYEYNEKLIIGCRGTHDSNLSTFVSNWSTNAVHHTEEDSPWSGVEELHTYMLNRTVWEWEKKHGKEIYSITGHSGGGWWASRILSDRSKIFRITFNADTPIHSEYGIHLKTDGDPVTQVRLKNIAFVFRVAIGEHPISFFSPLKDKDWEDLGVKVIESKELQENQSSTCIEFGAKREVKLPERIIPKYSNSTKDADTTSILHITDDSVAILNPEIETSFEVFPDVESTFENVKKAIGVGANIFRLIEVVENDLPSDESTISLVAPDEKKESTYKELFDDGVEYLNLGLKICSEYHFEKYRLSQQEGSLKDARRQSQAQYDEHKKNLALESRHLARENIRYEPLLKVNPEAFKNNIIEIRKCRREIECNINKLKESLESNNKLSSSIEFKIKDLDKLDEGQRRRLNKVLQSQRQYREKLSIFKTGINVVTTAIALIPGGEPYAKAVELTAQIGMNAIEQSSLTKTKRLLKSNDASQELNKETRSLYSYELNRLQQRKQAAEAGHEEFRNILIDHGNLYGVAEYKIKLQKEAVDVSAEMEAIREKSKLIATNVHLYVENGNIIKKRIFEKTKKIKDEYDKKYVKKFGPSWRNYEQFNDEVKKELEDIEAATYKDTILYVNEHAKKDYEMGVIKDNNEKNKKLNETKEKLEREQKFAETYTALRELKESFVILRRDPEKVGLTPETKILWEEMNKDESEFIETFNTGVQNLHETIRPYQNTADAVVGLARSIQNPSLIRGAEFISQGIKGIELVSHFQFVAIPSLKALRKSPTQVGKTWIHTLKTLGAAKLIDSFVVPGIQLLTVSISLGMTMYWLGRKLQGYEDLTEFQLTIKEIKKSSDQIIKFIDSKVNSQNKYISNLHNETIIHFKEVNILLARVECKVKREIKSEIEKVQNTLYNQSFYDYMSDIEDKLISIQDYMLKISSDASNLNSILELVINVIKMPSRTGFIDGIQGSYETKLNDQYLFSRPEAYTGLLAKKLNIGLTIPNWLLIEELIRNIKIIFDVKVISALEKDKKLLVSLFHQLKVLQQYHNNLSVFCNLDEVLKNITDRQSSIWKKIQFSAKENAKSKVRIENSLVKLCLNKFNLRGRQAFLKDEFIGAEKFFVNFMFNENPIFTELTTNASKWMPFLKHDALKVGEIAGKVILNNFGIVLNPTFITSLFEKTLTPLCYEILINTKDKFAEQIKNLDQVSVKSLLKTANPISPELFKNSKNNKLNLSLLAKLRSNTTTLKVASRTAMESIDIEIHTIAKMMNSISSTINNSATIVSKVYLDLKNKKFSIIKPDDAESDVYELINIVIHRVFKKKFVMPLFGKKKSPKEIKESDERLSDFNLEVELIENSLFKRSNLLLTPDAGIAKISPDSVASDIELYNSKVKKLHNDFLEFIDAKASQKLAQNDNIFKFIENSCQLIPSKNENLPPLAFPKNLLENLERSLGEPKKYYEAANKGSFICHYDFSAEAKELVLSFSLYTETEPQEYCRFVLAKFDDLTMMPFRKDATKADEFSITEFLVHVFYCSFVGDLGLPGKGSHKLSPLIIAPKEVPFKGLYKIWDFQNKDRDGVANSMVNYVSEKFEDGKEVSFLSPTETRLTNHFYPVLLDSMEIKQEFQQAQIKYNSDFYLLKSIFTLLTSLSENTIDNSIYRQLGLLSPENVGLLFDFWAKGCEPQKLLVENVNALIQMMNEFPSNRLMKYREDQVFIDDLIGAVNSTLENNFLNLSTELPVTKISVTSFESFNPESDSLSVETTIRDQNSESVKPFAVTSIPSKSPEYQSKNIRFETQFHSVPLNLGKESNEDKVYRTTMLSSSISLADKVTFHNKIVSTREKQAEEGNEVSPIIRGCYLEFIKQFYNYKEVEAKGNCLFISLGHFVRASHSQVRTQVCDAINTDREYFKAYFTSSVSEYLSVMRTPGEWGGEQEISAFIKHYERMGQHLDILVFDAAYPLEIVDGDVLPQVTRYGTKGSKPITLLRENDCHYSILERKLKK